MKGSRDFKKELQTCESFAEPTQAAYTHPPVLSDSGLAHVFRLGLSDQAGAALAGENRKERRGACGPQPGPKLGPLGRLPSPGPCAPFSVAAQDPAEVRKPDRGGSELRICSGVSNARWESLKLHLFCSPCSHHRDESHVTLQLPAVVSQDPQGVPFVRHEECSEWEPPARKELQSPPPAEPYLELNPLVLR